MAKANKQQTSSSDKAIAEVAYRQARPYTDPKADYDAAKVYRQGLADGAARRGQR